jgi:hypothetical protein
VDGEKFDELIGRTLGQASRRGVVRVGIGAVFTSALALLSLSAEHDAAAKKKGKKKKRKKVTTSPPPQPSRLPSPVCPGQVLCTPEGCCDQCCLPLEGTVDEGRCAGAEDQCCAAEDGGGFCAGVDTCCPMTEQFPGGTCRTEGGSCCDADHGGGTCDEGFACCPNDLIAENGSGCCENIGACCLNDGNCSAPETCVEGCCVDLTAVQSSAAHSRRSGGANGPNSRSRKRG